MSSLFSARRERLLRLKTLRRGAGIPASPSSHPTCPSCNSAIAPDKLTENQNVCPYCGHHFPLSAPARIELVVDAGSFRELDAKLVTTDPLSFPGYREKVASLSAATGLRDAVVGGTARIGGVRVVIGALDSRFLMGSMGAVVGERITRLVERAHRSRLPLILFSASGGARMQEGIISLMQMAKTSGAIERFSADGGLFISVLTNPTTGGVTASFASLGDIMLAEPNALIGFAGPRVIEQTIGEELPEGFQRSEFLLKQGFLDAVVVRSRMRTTLIQLLALHGKGGSEHVR